jgi:hypothetical protein
MNLRAPFWWKAYFWLMAALAVGSVFFDLRRSQTLIPFDMVDYGTWLFSLVGVFGFAYSKIILSKRLWQVWLPLVALWDIGGLVKQYFQEPVEMEPWFLLFVAVIAGIFILPEYLALYLYGYRSPSLWASKN